MPVKNQEALEQANSDAQLVVSVLLGEFGIYARSTENEKPMVNKTLGDVVSTMGCIEIQVSNQYENFSVNADKLIYYKGTIVNQIQLDRYFLLGAIRPGGKVYCLTDFSVVQNYVRDSGKTDQSFHVISPLSLVHSKTVWGDSIPNVLRRFMGQYYAYQRMALIPT